MPGPPFDGLSKEEMMDWKKVWTKGIRAALAGLASVAAIAAGEAVLGKLDSPEELAAYGVPAIAIPILLGLGASLRNWLKHRKAGS